MIDDIVEMIMKEARERDHKHISTAAYIVLNEVCNKVNEMVAQHYINEHRRQQNEN